MTTKTKVKAKRYTLKQTIRLLAKHRGACDSGVRAVLNAAKNDTPQAIWESARSFGREAWAVKLTGIEHNGPSYSCPRCEIEKSPTKVPAVLVRYFRAAQRKLNSRRKVKAQAAGVNGWLILRG